MTQYEFKCIHGIPFLYNSTDGRIFHYDTEREPIHIGHYNSTTDSLQLTDGWRELLENRLEDWKKSFIPHERGTFKRPATIKRPKKPRVSQRHPKKPADSKESITNSI